MTHHAEQLDIDAQCLVHLNSGGVSVLIDFGRQQLPSIIHWGASLGQLDFAQALTLTEATTNHVTSNNQDLPVRADILGSQYAGWAGRPGLSGTRSGHDWSPKFTVNSANLECHAAQKIHVGGNLTSATAATLNVFAADTETNLELNLAIELTQQGVLRAR